jgi:parallel beta-helix repeat protein
MLRICLLGLLALGCTAASAADFYVDPVSGSAGGDGSSGNPWLTLQQVVGANLIESRDWNAHPYTSGATLVAKNAGAPINAGDTIWLRDGYHGELILNGWYNAANITIRAQAGHTPQLSRVSIIGARNWVLDGISISPAHAPTYVQQTIITIRDDGFWGPADHIVVRNCDVFNIDDSTAWAAADWVANASTAFDVRSHYTDLIDNTIRNTRFGVAVSGDYCNVRGNVVDTFSGDGMRGLGDYDVFEYNIIKNALNVGDGNHDDGFQSWSVDAGGTVGAGTVYGLVLRGNTIINHENPSHPMRTTLQGIGCFDGWFEDWVIENNVVITDHWHGISLYGAINCRIVNNTVIDLYTGTPGPCWIAIQPHKNGQPSVDCTVRNNLTNSLNIASGQTNIVEDHNIPVTNPALFFVDPATYDLHLLQACAAVDTGSNSLMPALDADQIGRPYNNINDIGAYEWHPPGWTGPPAGGGGSGSSTGGDDGGCSTSTDSGWYWLLAICLAGAAVLTRRRSGT